MADQDQSTDTPMAIDTGITLPDGFRATVFGDDLGNVRHIVVRDDGTVYAAMTRSASGQGVVALRDNDGDGTADDTAYFADGGGTGIGIYDNHLYFSTRTEIMRWPLVAGEMVPTGDPEIIATFENQSQHSQKPFAFDGRGAIYVNVGAPANACQEETRTAGSPGLSPCPLLDRHAGIWRFSADTPGQTIADGTRVGMGIRNAIALTWNESQGAVYFLSHGRDSLAQLWPAHYTNEDSAELPSEEMHRLVEGGNYGWPYSYWNHLTGARYVGPEYGGDGKTKVEPGLYRDPIYAFPGHWAPDGIMFYTGTQFPAAYRGGAFIAFHGSWNRAPLPQGGYKVVYLPFADGSPSGDARVFADGFAGADPLMNPGNAAHRPVGLAEAPDGALFIGDDQGGRIWRVTYDGD